MSRLVLDTASAQTFLEPDALRREQERAQAFYRDLVEAPDPAGVKGWVSCQESAVQLDLIRRKGAEICEKADVFVLVGVGGSNQAARAVIESVRSAHKDAPEILYAGNTFSPYEIGRVLDATAGRSVYINVIAKNFETLEPGSHFRVLRQRMQERYSREEMARRVVLTGTYGSRLEEIAQENGYTFLSFPERIGGRYSAFSPVGLLPLAAMGLDIDAYLEGGRQMQERLRAEDGGIAAEYAAVRSLLYQKGFDIEMLASFEPRLSWFSRWWWQLFGESEGKQKKGIFPASAIYSEDLHSIGQYMQDGRRNLIETFLSVEDPGASVRIAPDPAFGDRFDYLDGMDFAEINRAAEDATIRAHTQGGVPCIRLTADRLDEDAFGQLYGFFMAACAVSGRLLGVDPFDQEGVEAYKRLMFHTLGKPNV